MATEGHTAAGKGQSTLERCAAVHLGVDLPKDVSDCKNMKQDLPKIEAFAQIFKNPKKLFETVAKNLWMNFDAFKKNVDTSVSDFDKKGYFLAGYYIGDAMMVVLGDAAPKF